MWADYKSRSRQKKGRRAIGVSKKVKVVNDVSLPASHYRNQLRKTLVVAHRKMNPKNKIVVRGTPTGSYGFSRKVAW